MVYFSTVLKCIPRHTRTPFILLMTSHAAGALAFSAVVRGTGRAWRARFAISAQRKGRPFGRPSRSQRV